MCFPSMISRSGHCGCNWNTTYFPNNAAPLLLYLSNRMKHAYSFLHFFIRLGASDELEFISDDELTDAIETDGSGGFGRSG